MGRLPPRIMRVFRLGAKPVHLGVGLCLAFASFAQEPGRLLIPLVRSVSISVTSNVAPACGTTISPSLAREDTTALLRGVGFTVSNIHNAQIAVNTECAALSAGSRNPVMSVNQCLSLSEPLPRRLKESPAPLTPTWQQCQSNRCIGAKCQELARAGLHLLLIQLLSSFQEYDSKSDLTTLQSQPQPEPNARGEGTGLQSTAGRHSVSGHPTGYTMPPQRILVRDVFYSLYVMNCFSLLIYWQFRRRQCHLT